jgi:anaerobic magnesium-protoporphyrin IX monomethyl ester cyclase
LKAGPGIAGDSDLNRLESAIFATVAYRDVFHFPVRLAEIHRYMHKERCEPFYVEKALKNGKLLPKYLCTDGEFFALAGRQSLFALRREREALAAPLWARAKRYAAVLASLPTVKLVAVTGSLSVGNPASACDDVDFLLVTEGGCLWRTRAVAKLLQLLDRFGSGALCVNHLLSERALALKDRRLYTAQELSQMVPLYGMETYDAIRAENEWSFDFLPNAEGPPTQHPVCRPLSPAMRRFGRRAFTGRMAQWIEDREATRKLRKYNETDFLPQRYSSFTREATGQRLGVPEEIETALRARLTGARKPGSALRILLGQAYHLSLDSKLWRTMQPYPPLGSLYAAAVARQQGHDVLLFDSMLSTGTEAWSQALHRHLPDLVLLYEDNFNYLTKMCLLKMREAALQMLKQARAAGVPVIVCSSDASDHPEIYLQAGADFVVLGEGEETLNELLGLVANDQRGRLKQLAGLAFLDTDGALVNTGRRAVLRDLDSLPLPAWDLVDFKRYRSVWRRRHGYFDLNMVTTRGCPYHCNWCAKPIWGQRYNARSPENVADEIALLSRVAAPDHIWFMDDIFGLKAGWIARFADALEARNLHVPFKCLSRADLLLRPGEIEALARAGCDIVWIGAESGSQAILDAMEKGTRIEDIESATLKLKDAGIRVGHFIQFGYPGEGRADIDKTIAMLRRLMPEQLGISVSYPLPGTKFYDRVRSQLGDKQNWDDSDDLAMLFRAPFSTPFYRWLHRVVHRDLRLRRGFGNLDRSVSSLSGTPVSYLRRSVRLTLDAAILPAMWLWLRVLQHWPHRGIAPLQPELSRREAAAPSPQPPGNN